MSKKMKKAKSVKKSLGTVVHTKALKTLSFTQRELQLLTLSIDEHITIVHNEKELGELDTSTHDEKVRELVALLGKLGTVKFFKV